MTLQTNVSNFPPIFLTWSHGVLKPDCLRLYRVHVETPHEQKLDASQCDFDAGDCVIQTLRQRHSNNKPGNPVDCHCCPRFISKDASSSTSRNLSWLPSGLRNWVLSTPTINLCFSFISIESPLDLNADGSRHPANILYYQISTDGSTGH